MTHVAHMAVRNRGTTCGSLALADPSAEMPAVAVLLNADDPSAEQKWRTRCRWPAIFSRVFTRPSDRDDEMITGVMFPSAAEDEDFRFAELSRRHGDFAIVGIAVKARRRLPCGERSKVGDFRVGAGAAADAPHGRR